MADDNILFRKIKLQIGQHVSRVVGRGYGKIRKRMIKEVVYGIQASKNIKISEIVRSLKEGIKLINVEERITRNLSKEDVSEEIIRRQIKAGSKHIEEGMVIACDMGDITKRHTKKMEGICKVRDGDTGEIRDGYHLIQISGAEVRGEKMVPLLMEIYSSKVVGFRSENRKILDAIGKVEEGIGKKGIWAMDIGGDRKRIIGPLAGKGLRFVIRRKGDRYLDVEGKRQRVISIAIGIRCREKRILEIKDKKTGKKERQRLRLGQQKVKFPEIEQEMYLVVIKRRSKKPMMLLTNIDLSMGEYSSGDILDIYLTRWKCDENFRYLKQAYNLEDIRLLKYNAIRNMVALLNSVFYFVSVYLGQKSRLRILMKKIYEKAERFFEVPSFKWYAVTDGIYKILFNRYPNIKTTRPPPAVINQLSLFPKMTNPF